MESVYLIKLIENGFYRGGIFNKKKNKFIYGESLDDACKFLSMTKDNATIEYQYLSKQGYNCFIDCIVRKDSSGDCAYSVNSVRKYIVEHMAIDPCTVYPVEAISDYLWSSSMIDIDDEECEEILKEMAIDKTCNVEYHIPSGGYLYVEKV